MFPSTSSVKNKVVSFALLRTLRVGDWLEICISKFSFWNQYDKGVLSLWKPSWKSALSGKNEKKKLVKSLRTWGNSSPFLESLCEKMTMIFLLDQSELLLIHPLFFTVRNQCKNNPCKNGATCFNLQDSYRCECKLGFSGVNCEKGK